MTLPAAPYTYDDPRLLYDEICFFYDGGYDFLCLTGPIFVGRGGGEARKRRVEKAKKNFVNVFIQHKLLSVNGIDYEPDEEPKWFRFAGENDLIDITIDGVKIDITKPMVEGKFLESIKSILSYSGSYESKAEALEPVIGAWGFHMASKSKEPPVIMEVVLEPYSDYTIDCELVSLTQAQLDTDKDKE